MIKHKMTKRAIPVAKRLLSAISPSASAENHAKIESDQYCIDLGYFLSKKILSSPKNLLQRSNHCVSWARSAFNIYVQIYALFM